MTTSASKRRGAAQSTKRPNPKPKPRPKPRPNPKPEPVGIVPAPAPGPTEIVPAEPPGAPTVEGTVAELNRIYVRGSIATALAMARVAARLVDDDEARLALGEEEPLLRRVAETPGLRFTPWVLWRAIAVYLQLPLLPPEVAELLPLSHQGLLLGVPDVRAKRALAARAIALSKRELAEIVLEYREKHHLNQGRPPLDPAEAGLRKMAVAASKVEDLLEADPPAAAHRDELLRWAQTVERRLQRVLVLLGPEKGSKS